MTIQLTEEAASIAAEQVQSGSYASVEAVVEDALRKLPKQEEKPFIPKTSPEQWRAYFDLVDAMGGFEEDFEIPRDPSPPVEREWF